MVFLKYLNYFFLLLPLIANSHSDNKSIVTTKCGAYIFQVDIFGNGYDEDTSFELYFKSKEQDKKLIYRVKDIQNFDAACVLDNNQELFMLFTQYEGGHDDPENIYGLFNPRTGKMMLNPVDWPHGNKEQMEKILGSPPLVAGNDNDNKRFFCCTKILADRKFSEERRNK